MGGDGVLLLSGFTVEDITVAEHGIPVEGSEHPARTPDAVWSFTSASGWSHRQPDSIFATHQSDAAIEHPASGRVLMHLAAFGDPSARWLDPRSGAVMSTADGAARLRGANMAYDAGSDRFIVFGGATNQTWAYDPAADIWTRMQPAILPAARNYGAMAYDPVSDRVILFGGGTDTVNFSDTWAYDYEADAWTELTSATAPPARSYTAMVYDSEGRRMILFGGLDDIGPDDQGEGWTYDGAFDEWDHTLADTWAFDPATDTWSELAPASAPSPRGWHAMAYEAETGLIVLFGGGPARGSLTAETWLYDSAANSWREWSSP
jgi:N-acetylneuraminic acid mutarotase